MRPSFRVWYQRPGGTFVTAAIGYVAATLVVASIRSLRSAALEQGRERLRIVIDTATARRWESAAQEITLAVGGLVEHDGAAAGVVMLQVFDVTAIEHEDQVATAIAAAQARQAEAERLGRCRGAIRRIVAVVESMLAKLIGIV